MRTTTMEKIHLKKRDDDSQKEDQDVDAVSILKYFGKHNADFETTSLDLSLELRCSHDFIVGLINSLSSQDKIKLSEPKEYVYWSTSQEGLQYAELGSPEYRLFIYLRDREEGVALTELERGYDGVDAQTGIIGIRQALKNKWVVIDKVSKRVTAQRQSVESDVTQQYLQLIKQCETMSSSPQVLISLMSQVAHASPQQVETQILNELKKRKLVTSKKVKYYILQRGSQFSDTLVHYVTDLTKDMVMKGTWKDLKFKPYNFYAAGIKVTRGSIHPLIRVAQLFKQVLLGMGFHEMCTTQWVESSFWNFDSLFQPQQHPSRDVQDTFFLQNPQHSSLKDVPLEYLQEVQKMHEQGGFGSFGWGYSWSMEEASKNVMRTHTTACSARLLFSVAQEYKRTGVLTSKRYFSIDRVFRNETLDATHLAEFHQVEGLICDRNVSLAHLIGVLKAFYNQIGISNLRFKPAYNPYTEPSMEIFGFHTTLNKWIEVGNSGMFRPEMLRPMGFPEDVQVIAWGLSLERPTMIRYGVNNIRELFGHRAIVGIA